MDAKDLARKLKKKDAPCVLDVRSGPEFKSGHVPGATHAPFLSILLRRAALPKEKAFPIVVLCEHGPRAQLAKNLLGFLGFRNLDLLDGHMANWRRAGLPLEK